VLTYEDCLGLCELTEEEIRAISEHEHIPAIVAAELGSYLVRTEEGEERIRRYIIEDIEQASARNDLTRVVELKSVLRHFVEHHPLHRKRA
jgi:hypothetical protein